MADEISALVVDLFSADDAVADRAEVEMDRLAAAGCPEAQRAGLFLCYRAWSEGLMTWDEFTARLYVGFDLALASRTVAEVLRVTDEPWCDAAAHPLFVAVLDGLADAGDNLGERALMALGDAVPAETMQAARKIAASWNAPEAAQDQEPPALIATLDLLPPLTRWGRVKWWLAERWWDARFWLEDMAFAARVRWWALRDRIGGGY